MPGSGAPWSLVPDGTRSTHADGLAGLSTSMSGAASALLDEPCVGVGAGLFVEVEVETDNTIGEPESDVPVRDGAHHLSGLLVGGVLAGRSGATFRRWELLGFRQHERPLVPLEPVPERHRHEWQRRSAHPSSRFSSSHGHPVGSPGPAASAGREEPGEHFASGQSAVVPAHESGDGPTGGVFAFEPRFRLFGQETATLGDRFGRRSRDGALRGAALVS